MPHAAPDLKLMNALIASRIYGPHTEEKNFYVTWIPGSANMLISRTGYPDIELRIDRDIYDIHVKLSSASLCSHTNFPLTVYKPS